MPIELPNEYPDRPKPPPFPKHDPTEGIPVWTFQRFAHGVTFDRTGWTKVGQKPATKDDPDWRGVAENQVIPWVKAEPYPYNNRPIDTKYFWFDTPDYADPFKKLWFATKYFVKVGLLFGCINGMVDGAKFTLMNNLHYLGKVTLPVAAAGVAASAATIAVANMRGKKDDIHNYLFGGLVLASILGRKNYLTWFRHTVFIVPVAGFMKYEMERNGYIVPTRVGPWNPGFGALDFEHGIRSGELRFPTPLAGQRDPGRLNPAEC